MEVIQRVLNWSSTIDWAATGTVVSSIATFLMAGATVWMAWQTKRSVESSTEMTIATRQVADETERMVRSSAIFAEVASWGTEIEAREVGGGNVHRRNGPQAEEMLESIMKLRAEARELKAASIAE